MLTLFTANAYGGPSLWYCIHLNFLYVWKRSTLKLLCSEYRMVNIHYVEQLYKLYRSLWYWILVKQCVVSKLLNDYKVKVVSHEIPNKVTFLKLLLKPSIFDYILVLFYTFLSTWLKTNYFTSYDNHTSKNKHFWNVVENKCLHIAF